MMYKDPRIIERINEIMNERQLTQKTLEGDTGISQSSISQMFSLSRSALPLIECITKVYGVNRNWMLTGRGDKYLVTSNGSGRHGELTDGERLVLIQELNTLQLRQQELMNETCSMLNEANKNMKNLIKINERLMFNDIMTIK